MSQPAESITCPRCFATSFNPNDVREGYCGRCRAFTAVPCVYCNERHDEAMVVAGGCPNLQDAW